MTNTIRKRNKRLPKPCPDCGTIFTGRNKYCSQICLNKNKKHNSEAKNKISKARKKYLKENPDLHPWKRSTKFSSEPCNSFKRYLTENNISFVEEYMPLEDRFFSVDIAFPDVKIGIEINGEQHYNRDGSLKLYYQERHDLIESKGWKLFEIHYRHSYRTEEVMKLVQLGEQPDYSEYYKHKVKKPTTLPAGEKLRRRTDEKYNKYIAMVTESNIDFSKYGWSGKVAKLVGIKPQKVSGWMLRYLPEFYQENCFKRKRS